MRDDADQPFSLGKAAECMDGLRERLLIERAEALVDEHRIQTDSGRRRGLHLIRKAERERQRGLERLAARERLDAALRAVVVVDDIKLQTGLGLPVVRYAAALELVLTARHDEQTSVCTLKDTIKEGHLDIGFERDLVFSGKCAVRRLRQHAQPAILPFQPFQLVRLVPHARKCSLIGVRPAVERALPLEQGKPLDCQCIALLPLRLFVDLLTARKLRLQLFCAGFQRDLLLAAGLEPLLRRLPRSSRRIHLRCQRLPLLFRRGRRRERQPIAQSCVLLSECAFAAFRPRQLLPSSIHRLLLSAQFAFALRDEPGERFPAYNACIE